MNGRSRGWLALFIGVVFIAGASAGFLLRHYVEPEPAPAAQAPPFAPPSMSLLLARLTDELDLTDSQRAHIEHILNDRRGRMDKERDDLTREISRALTPEQQERLRSFVARVRDRRGPQVVQPE
jgi:Spy/CpxP family protein refolding chaperone